MFDIQSKTTRHSPKQENTIHNEEKHQSIETNLEQTQMLDIAELLKQLL